MHHARAGANVASLQSHGIAPMVTKQSIVASLGEQALLLPNLINEGLTANDRFKYRLSILQLAARHVDDPNAPITPLRAERLAAGIDDPHLDELPAACQRVAGGYRLPGLPRLLIDIEHDVRTMLAPLIQAPIEAPAQLSELQSRTAKLLGPLANHPDTFTARELEEWASAEPQRADSLHLLVMDLHRMLNRLQQSVATQILDGAMVYALRDEDHALVSAFMRGVNRNARLRFDHPGLGTTATRRGAELLIQNDLGTTDAHVLVVHVAEDSVSITHTDVHLQRLLFFQQLLHSASVDWSDSRMVKDGGVGLYHVAAGRFVGTRDDIAGFLELLGSRLVFLLDWNRARKQLRSLVSKEEAGQLLLWAAEQQIGHMGFLRLGGAAAVRDAVDYAAPGLAHFGQTLDELLGQERAEQFLKFTLRTATCELLAGKDASLIHDELRAELSRVLRDSNQSTLDLVCEHAGLMVEIASAVRDALSGLMTSQGQELAEAIAARCKRWESDADRLVEDVRKGTRAALSQAYLLDVIERADDVADGVEEAAFLATLLRRAGVSPAVVAQLATLAHCLVAGSQEFVKALETLRHLGPAASRDDLQEFLEAIHRIARVEHETDDLKRRITTELAGASSAREIHLAAESAANLEHAADDLQHVAFHLRDQVIQHLAAS